jgi:hypothetical protein
MIHPLQCRCGSLRGTVSETARVNRGLCYCRDCQAFAHFLGRPNSILDPLGGTDVIQTLPARISFTQGQEALTCMRLTEGGLLRWYAACCNTPIGNTLATHRVSFVGLVHNCLENGGGALDAVFGPVRMRVNTKGAKQAIKTRSVETVLGILRFVAMVGRARIDGSYRRTPFFSVDTGLPIVEPKVLSPDELRQLQRAI